MKPMNISQFKNFLSREKKEVTCEKHGKHTVEIILYKGIPKSGGECPVCLKEKQEEDALAESQRQQELYEKEAYKTVNIYPRFLGYNFGNYEPEKYPETKKQAETLMRYCENFQERLDKCTNLVLWGDVGAAKTFFAISVLKEAINSGFTARYVDSPSMFGSIKSGFSYGKSRENEIIEELIKYDFLCLDELGTGFHSDFEKNFLFRVINERYLHMKPTIAITNMSIVNLKIAVGSHAVDRLTANSAIIPFNANGGKSLRNR